MKSSKFQFINPYLKEIYFVVNPDFNPDDKDLEMKNSFNVQIKRSENDNRS